MQLLFVLTGNLKDPHNVASISLVKSLARRGVQVRLVTSQRSEDLDKEGIQAYQVPGGNRLKNRQQQLLAAIRAIMVTVPNKIPLVVVDNTICGNIIGFANRILRKKTIFKHQGLAPEIYEYPKRGVSRLLVLVFTLASIASTRMVDTVLGASKSFSLALTKATYAQNVRALYNSIDTDRFISADGSGVREEINVEGNMILTAGVLEEEESQVTILEAMPRVLEQYPDTWLVIAGRGPKRGDLENTAKKLGIQDRVVFIGWRYDIERFMAAADILVHTAIYEPLGMQVAEAGACGKPAVVTRVGGMPEIIVDGETGLVVPPEEPTALAEAIIRLIRNPEEARLMGGKAQIRVKSIFSLDAVAESFLKIVDDTLGYHQR